MPAENVNHVMALLLKVSQGNEKAFNEIFHLYRNKVYTIAYRLTVSVPIAEEILQDVFLQVWLKREELSQVQHFNAWLFTITRNRTFSMLKRMASQKMAVAITDNYQDDIQLQTPEHPGQQLQDKEYRHMLQQAVACLSPQQEKVYTLIKEYGMKRNEAASALQLSPETVKRHLSEAMNVIRSFCLSRIGMIGMLLFLKRFL